MSVTLLIFNSRDAVVVAVINCSTSIFAGFAIFSLLGFMAERTNQDIANVVDQGMSGILYTNHTSVYVS